MLEKTCTFNDGVVEIYETFDTAPPGQMPDEQIKNTPKLRLRFSNRTVGVTRFWAAKQQNERIDALIRCPRGDVSTKDIAVIAGVRYEIKQVQHPQDIQPPVIDIALQRMVENAGEA